MRKATMSILADAAPVAPSESPRRRNPKPSTPYTGAITWLNVLTGHFEAASSTGTATYSGNALAGECSCPNATYRPGTLCRHLRLAREQFWAALDLARTEAAERAAHAGQQQWHTELDAPGWGEYYDSTPVGTWEGGRR